MSAPVSFLCPPAFIPNSHLALVSMHSRGTDHFRSGTQASKQRTAWEGDGVSVTGTLI